MWPWGHLAVGYLLCSLWCRRRVGDPPGPAAAVVTAVATQVPDLVDKPLAWYLDVLPTGRSLAHSLLVGTVVVGAVWWVAARADRRPLGVVFALGYLSHLAGDVLYPVLGWRLGELSFLLWPLLDLPEYGISQGVLARVLVADLGLIVFETALFVAAVSAWVRDGSPGLDILRRPSRDAESAD